MIRQLLISLMLVVGAPSIAAAASFDCDRAATQIDVAACNNPELSAYENLLKQYPEDETYLKVLFVAGTPIAEATEMVRAYKERQSGSVSIGEFFHNTMFSEAYLNNYDWLTDRIEERLPISGPSTYNWVADGVDRFFQLPIVVLRDIYKYEVVQQREYINSLMMSPEQFKAYWETEIDTAAAAKWFQASYHNQRFSDGQIDLDYSAVVRTTFSFGQILALFWLFTLCWSFKVATSHVREPSKDTLKRVFFLQLLGSTGYGISKGISDPKDIVFVLSPILWVPIVLAAAWVTVKALNLASTAYRYVYSRYDDMPDYQVRQDSAERTMDHDDMPDYQVRQDSAERTMDPQIVRFVDGSGNTRYRVSNQNFPTLNSAESYLNRLKSYTK